MAILALTLALASPCPAQGDAAPADPPADALELLSQATRGFAGFRSMEGNVMSGKLAETRQALDLLHEQPGTLGQEPGDALMPRMYGEELLAPARNLMAWSAEQGLHFAFYDTTVYQWANKSLAGTDGHAGINRAQLGVRANIAETPGLGRTIALGQVRYSSVVGGEPPLASQVGSPYTVDSDYSLLTWRLMRLYIAQQLGSKDLVLTVGKLNPNDYMLSNPYAGDETSQFLAGPLDGSDAMPLGWNSYTLGMALQAQFTPATYLNVALTSPVAGNNTGFDVGAVGDGGYWVGAEFGWVFDLPGGGPSRLCGGLSLTNTNDAAVVLSGGYANAWAMAHAELREDLGVFAQWSWSDPTISTVESEVMAGFLAEDIFGPKGGVAIGVGGGTTIMSDGESQDLIECFLRTQATPSIQFSIDLQYIPQPAAGGLEDVFIFGIRQTLTF